MMDQPQAVAGLTVLQNMVVNDKSVEPPGENAAFSSGNIAFAFTQLSRTTALSGATFKWAIAPLPSGPAGYIPTIGQAALVVFKGSPNQAVAQDFLTFITSQTNVAQLAAFWPPARLSVLNTDVIAQHNPQIDPNQIKTAITDAITAGKVVSSHPDFAKVDLTAHPFFDQMWVKGASVQDLMNQSCQALIKGGFFTK